MRQLVVLSRILDEVDGESFTTLEGRITLQKRIYLVQALGLDLGYRFAWNQYGPYSAELAQDGTSLSANRDEVRERAAVLRLRPQVQGLLSKVRNLQDQRPDHLTEAAWLELLTSIHFLAIESGGTGDIQRSGVQEFLSHVTALKPYFSNDQAEVAWSRIEGLEPTAAPSTTI
jgi:hypothetical protein